MANEMSPVGREKELSEMTLEKLWQLFPITLTPHNPDWEGWAKEEISLLRQILQGHSATITHIGSTAIAGIYAKPIIDILIEVPLADVSGSPLADASGSPLADASGLALADAFTIISRKLQAEGYILMNATAERMSFNKGYTPSGYADRVFHIHVHGEGDNDEILFRDYLISHPKEAKEYESLKLSLLPEYRNNRDGYTEQKGEFVRRIMGKAKTEDTF